MYKLCEDGLSKGEIFMNSNGKMVVYLYLDCLKICEIEFMRLVRIIVALYEKDKRPFTDIQSKRGFYL